VPGETSESGVLLEAKGDEVNRATSRAVLAMVGGNQSCSSRCVPWN
jgi:hypothetical protein